MSDAPGIGHNNGPHLDPGYGWRRHAWAKARQALWKPAPIEVVRRQLRRAKALGLDYKSYSLIVLGSGRDLNAFIVTDRALGAPKGVASPRIAKLAEVQGCEMILVAPGARTLAERLEAAGLRLAAWGPAPLSTASDADIRGSIRAVLDGRRLPGDAVALIGEGAAQKRWAEAARLAGFLPADRYFSTAGAAS